MKLFISYSREDAGDFAKHIHRYLKGLKHDVFVDVNSIKVGEPWAGSIEKNISDCEIFVIILTPDSLTSHHVEREVLQAQKQNKIIVPCKHEDVEYSEIKWDLEKVQGIEFIDRFELTRKLYSKIKNYTNIENEKPSSVPQQKTIQYANISEDVDVLNEKCSALYNQGKYQEAIECFDKVLRIDPSHGSAQHSKKLILELLAKEKPSSSYSNTISTKRTIAKGWKSPSTSLDSINKYSFINSWGSKGTGDGEFNDPGDIAVDSSTGYVYVADSGNCRIQKFDSTSNFIIAWGSKGTGDGQFDYPYGIAVDSSTGYVYVADSGNHHIQKFDSNGKFIIKWGSKGIGTREFYNPNGIDVDSSGNVYVADSGNDRIQKFDSNGNFITKWGSKGTGDGEFTNPSHISVDSSTGYVYVADSGNCRIQKFDSTSNFIIAWGSKGTGDGQFDFPCDISVDSSGNVYVADYFNNRIQKFDSTSNFIIAWGSKGTGDGEFTNPSHISVDSSTGYVYVVDTCYVYVSDTFNHRIQIFAPSTV